MENSWKLTIIRVAKRSVFFVELTLINIGSCGKRTPPGMLIVNYSLLIVHLPSFLRSES